MSVQLKDWFVMYACDDPYCPPENMGISLVGTVIGHPRKADGDQVKTSLVVHAEGRTVRTASGTVYELGEPSEDYRKWLLQNRPGWDPENPIMMLEKPRRTQQA